MALWSRGASSVRTLYRPVLKVAARFESTRSTNSSSNKNLTLLLAGATMLTGVCAYIYINQQDGKPKPGGYFEAKKKLDERVGEATLKIDLNEVYEQGAFVFLSNMEVSFISITTHSNLVTYLKPFFTSSSWRRSECQSRSSLPIRKTCVK